MSPALAVSTALGVAMLGITTLLLGGWLLVGAGAQDLGSACATQPLAREVPARLVPIFNAAAARYELGPRGAAVLAGLTSIESDFGRNQGPSSAGAVGWTQFLPSTWATFGVDADGDGRRDPGNPHDAIHAAANYLRHLGAPDSWRKALYGYNHSTAYVDDALRRADELAAGAIAPACTPLLDAAPGTTVGGGRIVPIPGSPGERIDDRILRDVLALQRRYRFRITDGYATSGHAADGEHPLGLALDLVPGTSGTWDDLDDLAWWAEPRPDKPRSPFRWVGYDGDANHGRGHHLHLSWQHGPARPGNQPPAQWVQTLTAER